MHINVLFNYIYFYHHSCEKLLTLCQLETLALSLPVSHPSSWLLKLDFLSRNSISLEALHCHYVSYAWPNDNLSGHRSAPLFLVFSGLGKLLTGYYPCPSLQKITLNFSPSNCCASQIQSSDLYSMCLPNAPKGS